MSSPHWSRFSETEICNNNQQGAGVDNKEKRIVVCGHRPKTKELLELLLLLFLLFLSFTIWFISSLKENLPDWESIRGPSDLQPSTFPLSYRAIDNNSVKIDFYISPQTLDQYWSTLVLLRS